MKSPSFLLADPYERGARLYPALIVSWPPLIILSALYSERIYTATLLLPSFSALIIPPILASLAREAGKKLEPRLYDIWGGKPSSVLLTLADKTIDEFTKRRYHEKLTSLTGIALDPKTSPVEQLEVCQAWTAYIRNHTRDHGQFPLLFAENINYGFRRNLLGLKPIALIIVIICTVLTLVAIRAIGFDRAFADSGVIIAFCVSALAAFFWLGVVTSAWVKTQATSHALRLLEACDSLPTK